MSDLTLSDIRSCFNGIIPIVLSTVSADGIPNITYMSRAHPVGDDRIAISNQFMSKSSRNLAENPYASLLLLDPTDMAEYRLSVRFERTEKRGPIFERLRNDISLIAGVSGMQGVFNLKAADIFQVLSVERVKVNDLPPIELTSADNGSAIHVGEVCARISRSADLDTLMQVALRGLDDVLGFEHSSFMLLDESGERLFTLASYGFEDEGVGSEIMVGEGVAGMAAAQCAPINVGNLRQITRYTNIVREASSGEIAPGRSINIPRLENAGSRMAVPALALGQLIGVLSVESSKNDAFNDSDVGTLVAIATLMATSVESLRTEIGKDTSEPEQQTASPSTSEVVHVRYFPIDGSVFFDGDYVIKGVAGRILWSLLGQYDAHKRVSFTNREVRLDPTLDLPDFRDNFESRLILLKRRLDERNAFITIEKTGRGKFRLNATANVHLESMNE